MNRPALRRRPHVWVAAVIAAAAMALSSCTSPPEGAGESSTVVVAIPSQATQLSWDAGYANFEDYIDMQVLLQAGLIRKKYVAAPDAQGVLKQDVTSFEGYLASGYTVSDDGRTYTFTLKDGIVSQAGNPLTADDVIWSFERKFDDKTTGLSAALFATAGLTGMDQIKKVDDKTVSIEVPTAGDGYTLLGTLADPCGQIYDSTMLKQHVSADDPYAVQWTATNNGFGFGPYQVQSLTAGSETVLAANPHSVFGEPEVKRIVRRVVPEVGNRVNALKSGDADIAMALRPSDMTGLQSDPSVLVPSIATNNLLSATVVVNKAPFDKVEARQAWAYAIDYDRIVDKIYGGLAKKQNTYLTPDLAGYKADGLPDWTYDPQRSRQLLADAGIDTPVHFTLSISNADPTAADIAVTLQDSAKVAGFDVKIEQLPPAQLAEKQDSGRGQAYIGWGAAWNLSPPYMLLLNYDPASGDSKWQSDKFEKLVKQGQAAGDVTSDKAGDYWNQAEALWLNQASQIIVAKIGPSSALSSKLTGWTWRTDGGLDISALTYAE